MPRDATVNGDGFRIYPWPGGDTEVNRRYNAVEAQDLLSVTSIRALAGIPYQLVNWQVGNVVNLAMGVRKSTVIGPRGGVSEKYVPDGDPPGEFVKRMLAVTTQKERDELRRWLRSTADEPRDIAAVRGSVVHKLIEDRIPANLIDQALTYNRMMKQWSEEKRKDPIAITDDDYNFVANALIQYEDMRAKVPFVIVAQEPQVYNLLAGYAGSADVIQWFLGEWTRDGDDVRFVPLPHADQHARFQKMADRRELTADIIANEGGQLAVGDWKTSKDVYTGHVVQTTAYMAAEFVARDGIIDERLTAILEQARLGMVIHIRPDQWGVDLFEMRQDVMRAFFGSVAFARFLAFHKRPHDLFVYSAEGRATDTEESSYTDDE